MVDKCYLSMKASVKHFRSNWLPVSKEMHEGSLLFQGEMSNLDCFGMIKKFCPDFLLKLYKLGLELFILLLLLPKPCCSG